MAALLRLLSRHTLSASSSSNFSICCPVVNELLIRRPEEWITMKSVSLCKKYYTCSDPEKGFAKRPRVNRWLVSSSRNLIHLCWHVLMPCLDSSGSDEKVPKDWCSSFQGFQWRGEGTALLNLNFFIVSKTHLSPSHFKCWNVTKIGTFECTKSTTQI